MDLGHDRHQHPTVHSWGVSRERVCNCGCWPFIYYCYYPNTSRDSVFPECGIFQPKISVYVTIVVKFHPGLSGSQYGRENALYY